MFKCTDIFFVVDVEISDVSNSEAGKKSMTLLIYHLWT